MLSALNFTLTYLLANRPFLLFLLQFLKPFPTSDFNNTNMSCNEHINNDLNSYFGIRIIENNITIPYLENKILHEVSCNVKNNVLVYHYKLLYIAGCDSDG